MIVSVSGFCKLFPTALAGGLVHPSPVPEALITRHDTNCFLCEAFNLVSGHMVLLLFLIVESGFAP